MAVRTRPPFRADHVGSLLRPRHLLQAREDHAAGKIDDDELRGLEDEAIREVVRMQEEIGLQSATDGEFRRASWHMDFIYQLDGVTKEAGHIAVKFFNESGEIEFTPAALHVDGKLGVSQTISVSETSCGLAQSLAGVVPPTPWVALVHEVGTNATAALPATTPNALVRVVLKPMPTTSMVVAVAFLPNFGVTVTAFW